MHCLNCEKQLNETDKFCANCGIKNDEGERYQMTIGYFDKVLNIDPNNIFALAGEGSALKAIGNHKEGEDLIQKAKEAQRIVDIPNILIDVPDILTIHGSGNTYPEKNFNIDTDHDEENKDVFDGTN